MRLVLAVSLCVALIGSQAHADWQYTRWGMTEAQIKAASKGQMVACDSECRKHSSDNLSAKLQANYSAGEFSERSDQIAEWVDLVSSNLQETLGQPQDSCSFFHPDSFDHALFPR